MPTAEAMINNINHQVFQNGFPKKDISDEIRTPEVTRNIRYIANHPACRDYVNQRMRSLAENYSFVIDGRDIGTVVFPDAKNKFYLDATPEVRAIRRAKEMNLPLEGVEFQTLCDEIISRDKSDMEREIAPLKKAESAQLIDTSDLSIEGVLGVFIAQIQS
jgi:cytidylate kinase